MRRTRRTGDQAQVWPDWRHHAFVTNRDGAAVTLDADRCELAIRDLKADAGLSRWASGVFTANAAWAALGGLATGPVVAEALSRSLTSHEVIVDTIAATTTNSGLTLAAGPDDGADPAGIRIPDSQLEALPLSKHDFHGDWNYTITHHELRPCHLLAGLSGPRGQLVPGTSRPVS